MFDLEIGTANESSAPCPASAATAPDIKIGTINAEAAANFTPGKQFYVDFTPA